MIKKTNIEAEGSELILRNSAGDYAIIPKDRRAEVKQLLDRGCYECIDSIVNSLPTKTDYAADGVVKKSEGILDDVKTLAEKVKAVAKSGELKFKQKLLSPLLAIQPNKHDYGDRNMLKLITETLSGLSVDYGESYETTLENYLKEQNINIEDLNSGKIPLTSHMREVLYNNYYKEFHNSQDSLAKEYVKNKKGAKYSDIYDIRTKSLTGEQFKAKNKDEAALYNLWKSFKTEDDYFKNTPAPMNEAQFEAYEEYVTRDIWRKYLGQPQLYNTVIESKYKPSIAKNPNAKYYTLSTLQYVAPEMLDNEGYYNISTPENKVTNSSFDGLLGDLGDYTLTEGYDKTREAPYLSIYTDWDMKTGKPNKSKSEAEGSSRFFSLPEVGTPFEIYDRIYYKDYGKGKKEVMYYSDKELKELPVDKFNVSELEKELTNRGYQFQESNKKKGELSEELKKALINWKNKQVREPIDLTRPPEKVNYITKPAPQPELFKIGKNKLFNKQ